MYSTEWVLHVHASHPMFVIGSLLTQWEAYDVDKR